MSYKVYKSQNYFVVHDTTTNEDVIRQVRNLVRWEKKGTLYSFYYNTPNLTTVGNSIVRLGSVYEFSDLVDSTGMAWVSQSALDLYLEKWTGHICCETNVDNLITVNGTDDFTINAGDSLDIILTDGTSSVTPVSVTPNAGLNKVDIVLPANVPTYATARLLKTGQTVSYRTGDDGDLEAGRNTDFITLLANNPFGNTNRFTDILGGQTYATAIVLDWSTYDGVSVLGYTKALNGSNVNWNDAVDQASATSIGAFTSGWRLTNVNELNSLIKLGGVTSTVLNYAPFSITSDLNVWSSTTAPFTTANAYFLGSTGNGNISNLGKTIAACRYFACRNFTVSGTTIS